MLERFPLLEGSALLLAVEEWLTPTGRAIWHRGITPDVVISLPFDVIPFFPRPGRQVTPEDLTKSRDLKLLEAFSFGSASNPFFWALSNGFPTRFGRMGKSMMETTVQNRCHRPRPRYLTVA